MTTPNFSDPSALDDYADAANAIGLAAMQQMQAEDWVQAQIENVTGAWGGIIGWLTDGLGTIITDIMEFITTGDSANLTAASDYVQSKIAGLLDGVVTVLDDLLANLLDALLGNYTGPDSVIGQIQDWASNIAANFGDLLSSLLGNYTGSDGDLLGIQDWAGDIGTQLANAVDAAVDAAVTTVTNAMNEIISGDIVGALAQTIKGAIEAVIDIIFGSGGSTWSQEVYFVSSQLQIGLNDLPLGWRAGYAGKITNVYVRLLANNATSGSAVLQFRKNAASFATMTLSTSDVNKSASGNWSMAAGDIIDINCTQVHAAGTVSGISVSFVGRYN